VSKPYDGIFKALADQDPRGLLFLFGGLPLEAPARVQALPREVGLPALQVDHVYLVQVEERQWLAHFEAQTQYKPDLPERLAWYGAGLTLKYRLPVETTLVLLAERHAPPVVPAGHTMRVGRLELTFSYQVIRIWEVAARRALESGDIHLFPWVSLMKASEPELEQAFGQLRAADAPALTAQAYLLAGLRYAKGSRESVAWLERVRAMLSDEILRESASYQGILEEGRAHEAAGTIRRLLSLRFPALLPLVEPEKLTQVDRLEDLLDRLIMATDEDAARKVIVPITR